MGTPDKKPSPKKAQATVRVTRKKTPKTSRNYEPPRRIAEILELNDSGTEIPFHSLVGHTQLAPYCWISVNDQRDYLFYENIGNKQAKASQPLRAGVKNVIIHNQFGKKPKAEFELYVPNYRNTKKDNKYEYGETLDIFKIGKKFSIKFGYTSYHTEWKNFVVVERDVSFSEGTALLKVIGHIGNKISSTTSADVFTGVYGKSSVEVLASVAGMKIDLKGLLEEEIEKLQSPAQDNYILSTGDSVGRSLFNFISGRNGLDFFVSPDTGDIKITTPYKMELLKKGHKAYKMTYGFPSSNISEIDITTKFPKKRRGSRRGVKLSLDQQRRGGAINTKTNTARQLIRGVLVKGKNKFEDVYYSSDRKPVSAGGTEVYEGKDKERLKKDGINVLIKKFPQKKGFSVQRAPSQPLGLLDTKESVLYNVYKDIKISGDWEFVDTKLTTIHYRNLLRDDNKIVLIGGQDDGVTAANIPWITAKVYTKKQVKEEKKKKEAPKKKEVPLSTTEELEYKWEEYSDVWIYENKGDKRELEEMVRKGTKDLESTYPDPQEGENYRVKRTDLHSGNITLVILKGTPKDRGVMDDDEDDIDLKQAIEKVTAAPNKPRSKPMGTGGVSGSSRSNKKALTTLDIKLKSGDWTFNVGRLFEIVDINAVINGYYYVTEEEHTIDTDGFQTNLKARKALKREVDNKGRSKKGSQRRPGTRRNGLGDEVKVDKATGPKKVRFLKKKEAIAAPNPDAQKRTEVLAATLGRGLSDAYRSSILAPR